MVVSNLVSRVDGNLVTAACVMDGAATEWDMSTNLPVFGDAVVELVAVERGMGSGRIVCIDIASGEVVWDELLTLENRAIVALCMRVTGPQHFVVGTLDGRILEVTRAGS